MSIDYDLCIDDDWNNRSNMINRMKSLNEDEFIRDIMFINSQKYGATIRVQRYSEDNLIDVRLIIQENLYDEEYYYRDTHDYSDISWIDYFECKFEELENEFTQELYDNLKTTMIKKFLEYEGGNVL